VPPESSSPNPVNGSLPSEYIFPLRFLVVISLDEEQLVINNKEVVEKIINKNIFLFKISFLFK